MLEDHGDLVAPQLAQGLLVGGQDVLALQEDLPGGRLDEPGEAADQGRLAGAGQPHHDEHLAGSDIEAEVVHRGDAGGLLHQLAR